MLAFLYGFGIFYFPLLLGSREDALPRITIPTLGEKVGDGLVMILAGR